MNDRMISADQIARWQQRRRDLFAFESEVRALAPAGIESAAAALALLILDGPQARNTSELAREAAFTPQTGTELVDRLVRQGHVERRQHPTDRRVRLLLLTEQGRTTAADLRSALADLEGRLA